MWIAHHDLRVELPDSWLAEAGLSGFRCQGRAYPVTPAAGQQTCMVEIAAIAPVRRAAGTPTFIGKKRTLSILEALQSGTPLPPVEIVRGSGADPHPYKLVQGAHRLYCSLALGFTHIPAFEGSPFTHPHELC